MAILKEGTKVKTTDGLTGNVEARYDLGTVVYYVVKMEDGNLYKYFADQLVEIEEEPAPEEPTGSDSITITREELVKTVCGTVGEYTANELQKDGVIGGILFIHGSNICEKVIRAIMGDKVEHV